MTFPSLSKTFFTFDRSLSFLSLANKMTHAKRYIGYLFLLTLLLSWGCKDHSSDYSAQGIFEAEEIVVSAVTSGELLRLDVSEGDQLEGGQVVGLIDTTFLALQKDLVDTQQATVNAAGQINASTQVAPLEAQLKALNKERDRYAPLVARGIMAQRTLDEIDAKISAVKGQIAAARATIGQQNRSATGSGDALTVQESQVDQMISRSFIKAPISGTVLTVYLHQGELAGQGMPLFRLANLKQMYLRAYVTAEQLQKVTLGQAVSVYSDMGEEEAQAYTGEVVWISDRAEFTPKNIQTPDARASLIYAIKVRVPNDGKLRIGQYGRVVLDQ